jgi:UDP-3-O-[3-hydroxymyristoyl] glucosamine N-acyltransferase
MRGTKLDSQVHVAHNCVIGTNALITGGVIMAGSLKVGANFVCGGNSAIAGHIEICDNVQIGGFSGISKSITEPGAYGGNPLLPLQDYLRSRSSIRELPRMRKQLAALLKKVGLSDEGSALVE